MFRKYKYIDDIMGYYWREEIFFLFNGNFTYPRPFTPCLRHIKV